MRSLLALLFGLLVAVGAWAQPRGKGMVANCTTAQITAGTCVGSNPPPGTRVYDTTLGIEQTYNGTEWVNSGGTSPVVQDTLFFCGELGANTDEFFGGPAILNFRGGVTDYTPGAAACDALGDTTVGTADAAIDSILGFRVNGMYCRVTAVPGTAGTVMTFVDDTVNTAVTCTIGALENSCSSAAGLYADVAVASAVAISTLNPTDDESAQDFFCRVSITWQ